MRRDLCYFYPADVATVYQAFLTAAQNKPFERSCDATPYVKFSFGVNFSAKYNMNGGAVTIHFMPYNGGTAVNMRFSIAQLGGARCEKYADDLMKYANPIMQCMGQKIELNVELFLNPANQVVAGAPAEAPAAKHCTNCGQEMEVNARFCIYCGTLAAPQKRFCPACGAEATAQAAFCSTCGNKL